MGCIYFVRHGQTIWNVENRICGASDIALTQEGHAQAIETGNNLKKQGISADLILYSPLIRAKDTALHISEITGIPAREEIRLFEQNFGQYESTPRNGEEFLAAKKEFASSYGGGESMLRLAARVYSLLDELAETNQTYILVAHNGIARVVQSYFYDMTNEEYGSFGVANCSVTRYDWDSVPFRRKGKLANSNNARQMTAKCPEKSETRGDTEGKNRTEEQSQDAERSYAFYGWETANVPALVPDYPGITSPIELYDALCDIWSADTCAPRMREGWTKENLTLGQCSITAFLAQDIFGGKVYGILRDGGNYHCYNVVGNCTFDLTSEQFGGEVLNYQNQPEQFKEVHFSKEEKRLRYEALKRALLHRQNAMQPMKETR